jgi:hypothetical protein
MRLHLDIEIEDGLLVAFLHGTLSFDALRRVLQQVLDRAREQQLDHILLDMLAVEGVLTTLERYDLGKQTAYYIHRHHMNPRIAFADRPPAADGFGVLVARNLGVVTEMFRTREKALDWLAEWSDPLRAKST